MSKDRPNSDSEELSARVAELEAELSERQQEFDSMTLEMAIAVSEFFSVMRHLTEGDFKMRAPETSPFELFAIFGEVINTTIEQLEARTENLKTTNQILRQEVSERARAEAALAEEKELLNVTLRSIGDGVISVDRTGRIVLINKAAEALTGWSQAEAEGRLIEEVFRIHDGETGEPLPNPARSEDGSGIAALGNQTVLIHKDGTERVIADSCAPIYSQAGDTIGVVLVFRDVTETKKMEEEMIRADKLESMGILAGGLAHDFNNSLLAILGNITLAKRRTKNDPKVSERLEDAERACLLAKGLTQQLLTFSKGGMPVKRTASIVEILEDTSVFALSGSNIECNVSVEEEIWPVDIDVTQICQVINNMTINAKQAMPKGGIVDLVAENVIVDGATHLPLTGGKYVKLQIRDEGTGIARDDLQKVFDPFFTTKEEGSGLGLTTAFSIVQKHGGHIEIESTVDVGTTVEIYLPASKREIGAARKAASAPTSRNEKVLLMDDEVSVRKVVGELLKHLGCEVEFAADGREAIAVFEAARERKVSFDVVILDLTVINGMGGKEAMERLLKIDPETRAIVSSGYFNDPIMANYQEYGFRKAVHKPFRIEDLSEAIAETMGGHEPLDSRGR